MSHKNWSYKRWGAVLFFLLSCHDAPRTNPFDPALTPAVELSVALDDTAGAATLTWSQYEGQQPFREYRVLRNIADRKSVDTLVHIAAVEQTAYLDTTLAPNTAYVYRVETLNVGGYAAPSEEKGIAGYAAGPVSLVEVEVDAHQGQTRLRWTHFTGAKFQGYRVERRSGEEEVFGAVARLAGVQDTVYVDEEVEPELPYFYRIVVQAGGQDWVSTPSSRQGFVLEPVQLLAATDDPQEGVVRLRWSRFAGPEFGGYQLWRRVVGRDQEEVVGEVTQAGDTTLVDGSARAGVDYEYRVGVQAAGQELFSNSRVARLVLPGVKLSSPEFHAETASVKLEWTPYTGPRFKAYQVVRRTAELAPKVVAEIADSTTTAQVDSGLAGNTEYFYRVVVVTEYGEELPSQEQSGAFHALVQNWSLDLEAGEYVRLYREGEGVTALVAGSSQVRLFFFDTQGARREEQVLLEYPYLNIEPRSVATALNGEGERLLSLRTKESFLGAEDVVIGLLRFGVDGSLIRQEQEVFQDSLPLLSGPEGVVEGEIFLPFNAVGAGSFDEIRVAREGQVLFADDFEDGDLGEWDFVNPSAFVEEGKLSGRGIIVVKRDRSWQDFNLEADVSFNRLYDAPTEQYVVGGIGIGNAGPISPSRSSHFTLQLDTFGRVILVWVFFPPSGSGLKVQGDYFAEPFFSVLTGLPYRLGLGFAEGRVSASVASPVFWSAPRDARASYVSLVALGERLALIAGSQPYLLNPTRSDSIPLLLESPASEMRLWEPDRGAPKIGICLPQSNLVAIGETGAFFPTRQLVWPFTTLTSRTLTLLGAEVGPREGQFLLPLSFDVGPDGRVYVLDAGNARIEVFDIEGKYLTQWGHKGSGEGEFNFGSGRVPEDFAGSVAVDSEGYIYVADVGNRRIQKFAP